MFKKASQIRKHLNEVDEEKLHNMDLEKSDIRAMVIAGLLTFIPPIVIACALIYFILWLIFLR